MDSIVTAVVDRFKQRSEFGQKKYGTNLDRTDLSFLDWVQHMQEELMDAILYLEKMKKVSDEQTAKRKCTACNETGIDRFEPTELCKICFGRKYVD
jgi:hypothetical protein